MEDEDGDMPVAIEGAKEGDKYSNINSEDVSDTEKSICSSKEKNGDIAAADHEDSIKPKIKNSLGVPGDIESETNNSESHSDSDVPLNRRKVNGEVELPKYREKNENPGNRMETLSLTKSDVPENEDNASEREKRTSRKRKRSVSSNELPESDHSDASDYKGVKKPALGEAPLTATKNGSQGNISGEVDPSVKCTSESLKSASIEFPVIITPPTLHDGVESSAQLTEYAQYLGLQPTVKFKCYKCGETGFPSMPVLQEHQNVCFKTLNKNQPLVKPAQTATVEPTPSTNFRITRKVYLCSVCGTYYENWNLFLHIREVHKRHICLFCLGMFAHSDNLVSHLSVRHGVIEESFSSADDFLNEYKGSCFLMCCTCEKLFTERENFFDHNCVEGLSVSVDKACSLCGLKGAHFPTCRQAFTDSDASPPQSTSSVSAALKCPEDAVQDPQLILKEQSGKKQSTPVNKVAENKNNRKELNRGNVSESNEKLKDLSDLDDEYDISNAASFCHVNIDETPNRNKANTEKDNSLKDTNTDKNKTNSETSPIKQVVMENKEDGCLKESNVKDNLETTTIVPENDESKICEAEQPVEQDTADQKNNIEETSLTLDVTEPPEEQKELNKDSPEEIPRDLELPQSSNKEDFHCENTNLDATSDKDVHIEEPKEQEQEDPDDGLLLKSEGCPKSPPKLEVQTSSKSPSATEAESESETSDSAEETDESSSSSDSSDESNHNDDKREKTDVAESDIDNADSDKMSLIVDETKSEDEKEMQDEVNTLNEMQTDGMQQTENAEDDMKEINELEIKKQTDQGSENENQEAAEEMHEKKEVEHKSDDFVENIQLAGDDVPLLELTLEENLDTLTIQTLLKESVKISCLNCVYCNHAKKIAVNGKQLALHLLAEHRFAPVVCSDSGELTEVDGFVDKLKASLLDLQQMFFNTDSYDNMDPSSNCQYDRTYECFHCHFVTTLHKELYVHNRKMHQKTILLCIMCKSNFYSYSELLCHLCPGIYVPESNITFRCCLCAVDGLPSAFRLMVHLRKRHHACDVCLETTGDQQKLSNHVWKHKLHHLCYRCGIAYRNKPDITKHLFWKHGTESVLCKKCLQKKWPHVYHFCIPPNAFVCEECNSTFSRAVALKVHKRIHAGDLPYACDECEERYISRKLLKKHQLKHRDPPTEENTEIKMEENAPSTEAEVQKDLKVDATDATMCDTDELKEKVADDDSAEQVKLQTDADSDCVIKSEVLAQNMQDETATKENAEESAKLDEKETERKSRVVDVYDLPPLNLSSESDDTDEEEKDIQKEEKNAIPETPTQPTAAEKKLEEIDKTDEIFQTEEQPVPIVDGIWDNFKNYKANLERRESQQAELTESSVSLFQTPAFRERESADVISIINMDHDYCGPAAGTSQSNDIIDDTENAPTTSATSLQENLMLSDEQKETDEDKKPMDADHNYCYNNPSSPSSNIEKEKELLPTPSSAITPSKKKQKSPKKKQKRSGSSSSSESSSNSDSSSCSCGTNCSCSSSSSSSSGTSSSSSDSDSSTSEGRRRQAARRERRRERAKKRKSEEIEDTAPVQLEVVDTPNTGPTLQPEASALPIGPELEETDLPIRESDLDTDETETDEDFYDKYPQKLANKLLAEKRNQLLLLAAVAPVNNGTMTQTGQSSLTSSVEDQTTKRKVKTKKRKRSHLPHSNTVDRMQQNLKMNIPSDYYTSQNPTFSKSSLTSTTMSPLHASSQSLPAISHPDPSSLSTAYHSTGSGSETESKRASKRKRVPKRFYGDSSDEETEQHPALKWRKVVSTTSGSPVQTSMPASAFAYKSTPLMAPEPRVPPAPVLEDKSEEEAGEDSDSDVRKSSSDSSNSESEAEKEDDGSDGDSDADSMAVFQTNTSTVKEGETGQQKNENLYCYCQCPYDEVSEMIACDGKDCTIEWFHFECVGIMVPPKGKWFCPDCRKRATSRSDYVPNV